MEGDPRDFTLRKEEMIQYRNNVAKEILQTEANYVQQLETLTNEYLTPLREENVLSNEEITKIFSVIELIRDVNRTLLKDIGERINNWDDAQTIGDVFLTLGPFLKMYSQYCSNFYSATEELISLRVNNRNFRSFEEKHKLPLNSVESYLILPVQRIPRYFLLLEDFLLNTWETHKDYENLVSAVQMIKDIADYVNNSMKTFEHKNRVYQIDLALGGECKDLVQPHRRWISEGELSRVRTALISYTIPVRLYLFNDLIVVAEKTISSFRYSCQMKLLDTFVVPEEQNCFKLITVGVSTLFACKTSEERNTWVKQIDEALAELIDTKGSASRAEYQDSRVALAGSLRVEIAPRGNYKLSKEHSVSVNDLDFAKLRDHKISGLHQSSPNAPLPLPSKPLQPKESIEDSEDSIDSPPVATEKSEAKEEKVFSDVLPEDLKVPKGSMDDIIMEFRETTQNLQTEQTDTSDQESNQNPAPSVELKSKRPPSTLFSKAPQSPNPSTQSSDAPYSSVSRTKETSPLLRNSNTQQRESCSCSIV